jgi:hypothetical protein
VAAVAAALAAALRVSPAGRATHRPATIRAWTCRATSSSGATVDTGKVIWAATASCIAQGSNAEQAGIAMIDNIFQDADKNRIADAGCPL